MSQPTKKSIKDFNEYECGNGPRPPVPGEESQMSKMTTECVSNSTSSSNRSLESDSATRIEKWQESFSGLLADPDGVELLLKFVEEESGENSINYTRLKFYFAVEGLKQQQEEKKIRKLIKVISETIRDKIEVSPELQQTIGDIVRKQIPANRNVFDDLQKTVEQTIAATSYRAFQQSELFIAYVQEHQKDVGIRPIASISQTTSYSGNVAAKASNSTVADGTSIAPPFGGMTVELSPLLTTPTLQTLHEDAELNLKKTTTDRPIPKLTEGLLLATQKGRLEVRPQGAHGYNNVSHTVSYNPVSRQDSERQSCSSASLTDSERNSKDGRPYAHRKITMPEDFRKCYNPMVASQKTPLKPLSYGLKETLQPLSQKKIEQASQKLNTSELMMKLTELKRAQDAQALERKQEERLVRDKLMSAQPRQLPIVEDDDQFILDQHVSRVFSPHLSPGTISPRHLHRHPHRFNEMSTSMPDFAHQSMRHSKSIPEHASASLFSTTTKKLSHKWPSQNIDSGIESSLYSANLPYKSKEMKSIEQLSEETMRKPSKEDLKKTRKPMPLPQTYQYQSNFMPTSSSHHTNSLPRMHESSEDYTYVVYTFSDEPMPYRKKIPGKQVTLKHYKEHLPKKGNFRFFFTTHCASIGTVQEEVTNDMDVLPLHEGRIMGYPKIDN